MTVSLSDDAAVVSDRRERSFGHLDEALLNELRRPRHGVGIDLDVGEQVGVDPAMRLCRGTAQFDSDPRAESGPPRVLYRGCRW